jgi:hypothetical protein
MIGAYRRFLHVALSDAHCISGRQGPQTAFASSAATRSEASTVRAEGVNKRSGPPHTGCAALGLRQPVNVKEAASNGFAPNEPWGRSCVAMRSRSGVVCCGEDAQSEGGAPPQGPAAAPCPCASG